MCRKSYTKAYNIKKPHQINLPLVPFVYFLALVFGDLDVDV